MYGQGMCNNIWLAVTEDDQRFLIKQEREDKSEEEQNNLLREAKLIEKLKQKNGSLPIPDIVFINESPKMYGYTYVAGDTMKNIWNSLSDGEKTKLCESLGRFHADLQETLTEEEIFTLGIANSHSCFDPEEMEDLERLVSNTSIAQHYRRAVEHIFEVFTSTDHYAFDKLCHNDSHFENILVHEGKLACVIDFGDADFGDVHREFTRYYQDFPAHLETVLQSYEAASGHTLSRKRIKARSILDIADELKDEYFESGRIGLIDRWLKEK